MFVACCEALMDVYTWQATPTGLALDARIVGSQLMEELAAAGDEEIVAKENDAQSNTLARG
jgi:hypothetical protein